MPNPIIIHKLPPVWFIRILIAFRNGLLKIHRSTFPANVVMYERLTSFWVLAAIRVAAELDIAGILEKGPLTIEKLAENTGSDPDALFRMMRALVSEGIFKLNRKGLYKNTFQSKVLAEGKGSLRQTMMQHLGTLNWTVFNDLSYCIRTGKSAFSKVYGLKIYDYLAEHKLESELFDRSMTNLSEISIEPILNAFDFSNYPLIADIGGGEGLLLSSILYKTKHSKGILFDLPEGLANSKAILEKYGVTGRVEVVEGSFFTAAPAGADAYILKNILHNWSQEDSVRILTNIRKNMPPHAKILILEMILGEDSLPFFGKLIDLQMMVFMEAGKERTLKEFDELLHQSGLKLNKVIPTIAPISIIEAVIF
jgi:DNA-binding Lrp family transcriptional regulator